MDSPLLLPLALLAVYAGLAGIVVFLLPPGRTVARSRRRPLQTPPESALNKAAALAAGALDTTLRRRNFTLLRSGLLERAGVKASSGEVLIWCGSAALVGALLGAMLAGVPLAVFFAVLGPSSVLLGLSIKARRRQAAFADQLPDTLQLLAGSMRAGHSFARALAAAAEEAESPTDEELRRVVNEARIGRDLVDSLIETAGRMDSEDLLWTAQAVETQREMGGNLTEILENVQDTIRERAQVARQVRALSAEGRMSGVVLILLPVVMLVLLSLVNPSYAQTFFTTVIGWIMLIVVTVLLAVGWFWISRLVKAKY